MAHGVAGFNLWRHGAPCVGPSSLTITSPADGSHICPNGEIDFTWGVDACSDQVTVDWAAGGFTGTMNGGSGSITGITAPPGTYTLLLTATGGTHPSASINVTVDIAGCTDSLAVNFNPSAVCDDGSCCYVAGCTDPSACNFDSSACFSDGSCTYPGCTDPGAYNYNPSAGCDDGSCCYTSGCTDSSACNFNPSACFDDGSCYSLTITQPSTGDLVADGSSTNVNWNVADHADVYVNGVNAGNYSPSDSVVISYGGSDHADIQIQDSTTGCWSNTVTVFPT